jgi:TRAP-type C4-dicarboxylate transport system permease large subunit
VQIACRIRNIIAAAAVIVAAVLRRSGGLREMQQRWASQINRFQHVPLAVMAARLTRSINSIRQISRRIAIRFASLLRTLLLLVQSR